MSLTEAYRKQAIDRIIMEPLERIWEAKWAEGQREAFLAELSAQLATDDPARLKEVYDAVINNHGLVRFPSIAHILKAIRKERGEGRRGGKLSDQEVEKNRQWLRAKGYAAHETQH